jgi:Zn-finger nucleic acid-binding protein
MPDAKIVNCATNKLRKEESVGRAVLKRRRKLVCPACNAAVYVQTSGDDVRTCPRCGEWLVERERCGRRADRWDGGHGSDFDESDDWERSLTDSTESPLRAREGRWHR